MILLELSEDGNVSLDWTSKILSGPILSVSLILSISYNPIYRMNHSSSSTTMRCVVGVLICVYMFVSSFPKLQGVNLVLERS